MEERSRGGWLLAGGVLYAAVSFGILLPSGGGFGPAAFHPLLVPLTAGIAVCTVVGLSDRYAFRWWAIALFVGWVGVVACVQWLICAAALAAV